MSEGYPTIAETDDVRAAQARLGSRSALERLERPHDASTAAEPRDPLTGFEREFVGERDGFYLASVSSSGWPYVQFRGGPPGFVHSRDEHTIAWADFRGNRQYISTGNIAGDERVSLFFMDYPNRLRLKVFGRARTLDARDAPDVVAELAVPGYRAIVEQVVVVTVVAFDWNCPQHITPRYSEPELEEVLPRSGRSCATGPPPPGDTGKDMTPMTTGIRTPFDFSSTADDVIDGIDLSGHRAIVTGGSSGIGVETARALASAGAEVTLAVRRTAAGDHVAAELVRSTGNEAISVQPLELSDQRSVTRFVDRWTGPLHILVNNAGIMANPELERTDFRPYDPFVAYGQFKSADALLAVEATRRWSGQGIYANAVNPGAIATNLQRHTGGLRTPENRRKTPRQGASTSVLLAASPLLNGVGGRYFEDNNEARTVTRRPEDYTGVAWYALDPANAERLWNTAPDLLP